MTDHSNPCEIVAMSNPPRFCELPNHHDGPHRWTEQTSIGALPTPYPLERTGDDIRAIQHDLARLAAAVARLAAHLAELREKVEGSSPTLRGPEDGGAVSQRPRLRSCVENWPECWTFGYDPRCCRFPKSCSCDVYDDEFVTPDDLEPQEDQ